MKRLLRWIYPLLLGFVMFNCIRLVTDLPKNSFWSDSKWGHIQSLAVVVLMCYVYDVHCRYYMAKARAKNLSAVIEYAILMGYTFVAINLIMMLGEYIGVLYMGNKLGDYAIANVICLLLFLLYYIIIRNNKLEQEYTQQSLQLEKIKVDQLEIELKFLRAQYHPHFLFNALNTVYFQIDEKNPLPRRTLEMLSELLRYQLYGGNKKVPVQKEIDYLKTYMNFQRMRISERLELNVQISEELKDQEVYPLLFLPLVENAFKYVGGDYLIDLVMLWDNGKILFNIINSKPMDEQRKSSGKGIGLENLRRRLILLYPDRYSLDIQDTPECFIVQLVLKTDIV